MKEEENTRPFIPILSSFLLLSIIFLNGCLDTDDGGNKGKDMDPISFNDAKVIARSFVYESLPDAVMISCYGCEFSRDFNQDLHPGVGFRTLCPKDNKILDGMCYYWTFIFLNEKTDDYLEVTFNSNGEELFGPRMYEVFFQDAWYHENISGCVDTLELDLGAKNTSEWKIDSSPGQNAVVYWLLFDPVLQMPTWIVYNADRTKIRSAMEFNGETGKVLEKNFSFPEISFQEGYSKMIANEAVKEEELRLVRAQGYELSSVNPNYLSLPNFRYGYLIPPDPSPGNGRLSYWHYKLNTRDMTPGIEMVIWSTGITQSRRSVDIPEKVMYPKPFNYSLIIDSPAIQGILNNNSFGSNGGYYRFSLGIYLPKGYYGPDDWKAVWGVDFDYSPDCIGSNSIDAITGEVI
ncbi:MAG: hypothetical protein ACMUHM_02460 [Thermoplasmatota archaeon]